MFRRKLFCRGDVISGVDAGRRALKNVEMLGTLAKVRHDLHGGGASADDGDGLVAEAVQPR